MENNLSQNFLSFYEETFKPMALKCSEGYTLMLKSERGEISENNPELDDIKKLKDPAAVWYIGLLVSDVESAKFSRGRLNLINSMSTVNGCLNSESYWANVWNNDLSSDEAKNLKELSKLIQTLISKL